MQSCVKLGKQENKMFLLRNIGKLHNPKLWLGVASQKMFSDYLYKILCRILTVWRKLEDILNEFGPKLLGLCFPLRKDSKSASRPVLEDIFSVLTIRLTGK